MIGKIIDAIGGLFFDDGPKLCAKWEGWETRCRTMKGDLFCREEWVKKFNCVKLEPSLLWRFKKDGI